MVPAFVCLPMVFCQWTFFFEKKRTWASFISDLQTKPKKIIKSVSSLAFDYIYVVWFDEPFAI